MLLLLLLCIYIYIYIYILHASYHITLTHIYNLKLILFFKDTFCLINVFVMKYRFQIWFGRHATKKTSVPVLPNWDNNRNYQMIKLETEPIFGLAIRKLILIQWNFSYRVYSFWKFGECIYLFIWAKNLWGFPFKLLKLGKKTHGNHWYLRFYYYGRIIKRNVVRSRSDRKLRSKIEKNGILLFLREIRIK